VPTPLPDGVACYVMAATSTAEGVTPLRGDGLVPVASALGQHADPRHALTLPAAHCQLVHAANHWDLLDHPDVTSSLRRWLA
jgi:hypothetical protein